jgi:hypothetical protein
MRFRRLEVDETGSESSPKVHVGISVWKLRVVTRKVEQYLAHTPAPACLSQPSVLIAVLQSN